MAQAATVLQLIDVGKHYSSTDGGPVVAVLRGVHLAVPQGQSVAIVGPSGSGKSTLLNIIGTLDRPSQGQVLLEGEDVSRLDERKLAVLRNQRIGFVFQAHHLLPQCTVLENVLVPTIPLKDRAFRAAAETRARALLDRVGLGARLTHRPGQLSGGERQRVAVVRALINEPKLLLADEPTGALDRASAEGLAALLLQLNREQQVTLILVTHALDLAHRMQQVFELHDGKLELMHQPAKPGAA
jgi:ABC-type lipoprotein export system ATPase subunit